MNPLPRILIATPILLALALAAAALPATAAPPPPAAPRKFAVHEIALPGNGSAANPFTTTATVRFTPPSGAAGAVTVQAFFDGGNTWRARVYVSEAGSWRWTSQCDTDPGLDRKSGQFTATDSNLRGRLLVHPRNPRQWMTDESKTARLWIDLTSAPGSFEVEWVRALDGATRRGPNLAGGREVALTAPWPGADVVLRLRRL